MIPDVDINLPYGLICLVGLIVDKSLINSAPGASLKFVLMNPNRDTSSPTPSSPEFGIVLVSLSPFLFGLTAVFVAAFGTPEVAVLVFGFGVGSAAVLV